MMREQKPVSPAENRPVPSYTNSGCGRPASAATIMCENERRKLCELQKEKERETAAPIEPDSPDENGQLRRIWGRIGWAALTCSR